MTALAQRLRAEREALLVLALLLGLAALFLWPLWAPRPADRMTLGGPEGDFLRQFYPYRAFVAAAWGSLQVPLWNPFQYAGTPAWADPQLAVLYPWRWLQVPLALAGRTLPLWSVHLEAIAHLALGGWFTYLLGRRLGAGPGPALVGGVTFAFGGYLTGYPLVQLAVLDTAIWLPATLWALSGAVAALVDGAFPSARRWALGAAGATALAVLAGHPQTAMYCLYAGAGWLAWCAWRTGGRRPAVARLGGLWLVAALGLSAAAWLPAADFLRRAARSHDYTALAAGLPPKDLVQVLAPYVVSAWSPLYVGLVALVLGLWALRWVSEARPWLALAGLAWILALGGNAPLYPILYRLAPGFALFRQQERAVLLVSLGLAVAAALALQALSRAPGAPRAHWAFRLAAALAALLGLAAAVGMAGPPDGPLAPAANALSWSALMAGLAALCLWLAAGGRLGRQGLVGALVALTLLDLFSVNQARALVPGHSPFVVDPLVSVLEARASDGRVSSEGLLPGGPNAASVWRLQDTTGDSPLHLAAVASLVTEAPEMVWWRLLGVRFLLTGRPFAAAAPVLELARDGPRALYEVQLPVPPTWVPEAVVSRAGDWRPPADFDPLALAVLPTAAGVPELRTGPGGQAHLTGQSTDRVLVTATLPAPGLLVAAVAYEPGWRARAKGSDGTRLAPATVPAYGSLLSTLLPAGSWEVEWTYRPKGVSFGLAISAIFILLGAVIWQWPMGRRVP